jgi:Flp pilus assembly protein TadG
MHRFRPQRQHSRSGVILSLELVLVLPIFLLLLFAIVEFSLLTTARIRISDAAHAGARRLCLTDTRAEDIRDEVKQILFRPISNDCDVCTTNTQFKR